MISEKEFRERVEEESGYEGRYWNRLDSTMAFTGIGWAGPLFLFQHRQRENGLARAFLSLLNSREDYRESFRICGAIGENLRIADDILDGDGTEPTKRRKEFLSRYIESLRSGKIPPEASVDAERVAFAAAQALNEELEDESIRSIARRLEEISELVETEDKSEVGSYLRYVEAAGEQYGMLLMESLEEVDGVEISEADLEFARDYGFLVQVADDRLDDDTGMDDGHMKNLYESGRRNLSRHSGLLPWLISHLARLPVVYELMIRFNRKYVEG